MNTLEAQEPLGRPYKSGLSTVTGIVLFITGMFFGALALLFVVLMQWYMPDKLGWSITWLPMAATTVSSKNSPSIPTVVVVAPRPPLPTIASSAVPTMPIPQTKESSVISTPDVALSTDLNETTSTLLIPVSGISATQLSDTFEDARGADRIHDAIDIMAPRGTPVVAVHDGKIVKLFNSKQGGLTIYQFDVAELHAFYYAHLDSYASGVLEGKNVHRGDLIGYVGSTGNASPDASHLHFAVFVLGPEKKWWQGNAINPYPLLTNKP